MSGMKKLRLYYLVSAVMLTIFSGTFLLMPLSGIVPPRQAKLVMVLTGAVFWISCLSGYGLLFMVYRGCRHEGGEKRKSYFFSNRPTIVADTFLIAGLAFGMVLAGLDRTGGYVVYADIFLVILAFNMHLLFCRGLHGRVGFKFNQH